MKFFLLAFLLACSSPTPYQKKRKGEGYADSEQGKIRTTEFYANSHTKTTDALLMAQYRARKVCSPQLVYFLSTDDLSRVKEITRTSGTTPFYNTGYYPYRRGWSMGVGFGSYSSESWQDKQIYPQMKVSYLCGEEFYAPRGEFKNVSASELSYIHKDLLGAILVVNSHEEDSLEKGDIILKINGKRVELLVDFYYRFQQRPISELEILRDGERKKLIVKAEIITDEVKRFSDDVAKRMCHLDKKECPEKN